METRKLCIAAGAALFSTSLFAQTSVQLYGITDAGVEYLSKVRTGAVGSPTAKDVRMQSGGAASSRLGFRGREDLGGGLSALFVLENGFTIDNGVAAQGGRLFGRKGYVALAGRAGELQLGRQPIVINDFGLVYDPVGPTRYSTPVFDVAYIGRADNALKYVGEFGGLRASVQYSLGYNGLLQNGGEVPGAFRVGKEAGAFLNYTFGNFQLGAAYDRQNGTSVATQLNKDERAVIGALAKLNRLKLVAAYQREKIKTPATSTDINFYWVGAQYQTTTPLSIWTGLYFRDPEGSNNRSTMLSVFASYALSKRTDLYTEVAMMRNQGLATSGMFSAVNPGDSQTGAIFGLRHRF